MPKYFNQVMRNFVITSFYHHYLTTKESPKFLSRWLFGRPEQPQRGLQFEQHCHSHFSDEDNQTTFTQNGQK